MHAPPGGQLLDQHEPEPGLIPLGRSARTRQLGVGVEDFNPYPANTGHEPQSQAGLAYVGVPDHVAHQLGDQQDHRLLELSQIPYSQGVLGEGPRTGGGRTGHQQRDLGVAGGEA
jgi:hypothetical protein